MKCDSDKHKSDTVFRKDNGIYHHITENVYNTADLPYLCMGIVLRTKMVTFILFVAIFLIVGTGVQAIFVDVVVDLLKYYWKSTVVTEFSCNKKESFSLLKKLMQSGYPSKISSVNSQEIEYPFPPNHQVFVLNLDCKEANNLLRRADQLKFFRAPFRWVCYHSYETETDSLATRFFSEINILVDSDVTLCEQKNNGTVQIKKLYKKRSNLSIDIEEMGFWTNEGGIFDHSFERNSAKRRMDLEGTKLISSIVITNNDSLNHLTDKRYKHIDSIGKVNYVLVEHLKDVVNATMSYSIQPTWGYKNNKSEWSGMIGEVIRNEADIAGTASFFTIDRVDVIDYIAMTTPTRSKFVFRQPTLSYVSNVYLLPFDNYVWLSTIFLVIIVGIVLYITVKWEWHRVKYQKFQEKPYPELRDSVTDVAILSFGAVCQQGAAAIPFSIPGRITTIMLFISLMFLYTSYSANIVALLQSSSNSIRTLEDLLKSRLQIGVHDTVFNRYYFPNATEPIRRALYLQKVSPPGKKDKFMSIEEGVGRLRKGLFAFHMETGPGYQLVGEIFQEHEKCGLQEIQFIQVVDPWLAIQKNSSYKKMLKIGLRKIRESGLQSREVGLIYTKRPVCTSRGSSFISVGIVDCYPATVVLAMGFIAAMAVFTMEIYIYYRRNFLQNLKLHFQQTKYEENRNDVLPYTN